MVDIEREEIIKDYKENYLKYWGNIFDELEYKGNCIWLQSPSGYIMKLNGTIIGMDIPFRTQWVKDLVAHRCHKDVEKFNYYLLSHAHIDHFCPNFLPELSEKTQMLVPEFFSDEQVSLFTHNKKNISKIKADNVYTLGNVNVHTFNGNHFRPNGKGIDEFGYMFESGNKKLLFPVDMRDYNKPLPNFGKIDILFAHVWFSDDNTKDYSDTLLQQAEFIVRTAPKKVVFAHLDDFERTLQQRWSRNHAKELKQKVNELNSDIEVIIPNVGDRIDI